jgi:hypothetical protein
MQWITAALAFAVTMLIFAMVTSALVESIHRLLALRTAGLRLMLENVFTKVIAPHLSKDSSASAFATSMMENRATAATGASQSPKWLDPVLALIDRFTKRFFGITDIPVEVFTQKLADAKIEWKTGKPADGVITDIAQKYEAFGREASDYFQSRARLLSVVVAIPVAWGFFVHPYKLALVYTKNPEVARAVADQAVKISAEYEALRQRLAGGDAKAVDIQKAVDTLKDDLKAAADRSKELAAAGVPLGWPPSGELAKCSAADSKPSPDVWACTIDLFGKTRSVPNFWGAIWLTIGGLLIGLGAPFWAKTVSALTSARSGSWQRLAEIVGVPAGGGTSSGTGAQASPPMQVANRTFELSHAAAQTAKK